MWSKALSRTDWQAGRSDHALPDTGPADVQLCVQPGVTSFSARWTHNFSGSGSGKSSATSTLKLQLWERKKHLTLFTEGLPAPVLVAQLLCWVDLQRSLNVRSVVVLNTGPCCGFNGIQKSSAFLENSLLNLLALNILKGFFSCTDYPRCWVSFLMSQVVESKAQSTSVCTEPATLYMKWLRQKIITVRVRCS